MFMCYEQWSNSHLVETFSPLMDWPQWSAFEVTSHFLPCFTFCPILMAPKNSCNGYVKNRVWFWDWVCPLVQTIEDQDGGSNGHYKPPSQPFTTDHSWGACLFKVLHPITLICMLHAKTPFSDFYFNPSRTMSNSPMFSLLLMSYAMWQIWGLLSQI